MPKEVVRIPNAAKTQDALRGLGYDFNASVADLIDNSIAANARNIGVYFFRQGKGFKLFVIDDGDGMDKKQLAEAITYGSEVEYDSQSLGKFGMGLKTASLAHCDKLIIFSKKKGKSKHYGSGIDTLQVSKKNRWITLDYSHSECNAILKEYQPAFNKMNTIVMWDILKLIDREYAAKTNDRHKYNYQESLKEKLRIHLELVFHRFIQGYNVSNRKKLKIDLTMNGDPIGIFDPYCREETYHTPILLNQDESFYKPFEVGTQKDTIRIQGHILPNKEQFSSIDAWDRAKGNQSWNDSQGFYIYRNSRLIRFGGWQRIIAKDEHTKYARVSIDIPDVYDDLFKIVVHKAAVSFPESLRWHLKKHITPKVARAAKKSYKPPKGPLKVKNKFRKHNRELSDFSKNAVKNAAIEMSFINSKNTSTSHVRVINKGGDFISNRQSDNIKHHIAENMVVTTGALPSDDLWKIISDADGQKFTVVINQNHPFCKYVYTSKDSVLTSVVDALFYTMGFSELYTKTEENEEVFLTIKEQMSIVLKKLTKEKLY